VRVPRLPVACFSVRIRCVWKRCAHVTVRVSYTRSCGVSPTTRQTLRSWAFLDTTEKKTKMMTYGEKNGSGLFLFETRGWSRKNLVDAIVRQSDPQIRSWVHFFEGWMIYVYRNRPAERFRPSNIFICKKTVIVNAGGREKTKNLTVSSKGEPSMMWKKGFFHGDGRW
jgi:hypothetical protein